MDSDAEPIVQAETPSAGTEEQPKQDDSHKIEASMAEPIDDDDAVLAKLLDSIESDDDKEADVDSSASPSSPETESDAPAFDRDAVAKVLKRDGVPDEVIASAPHRPTRRARR